MPLGKRSLTNYDIDLSFIYLFILVVIILPFSLQEQGKGGRHGKTINIFSIASGHL